MFWESREGTPHHSTTAWCFPQSILHASLEHNALSLEKFSRWLRAICTILLSRDSNADRPRAIGFVEQAISVLKEQRSVEVRALGFTRGGLVCLMVNVTERIPIWGNTATFACFSRPYGQSCCYLGLSHRRASMAVGYHIQHWYRMLAVRSPSFRSSSFHYRPFFAWPPMCGGVHLIIGVFVCAPVSDKGP